MNWNKIKNITPNKIILPILGIVLIIAFFMQRKKEESLLENKKVTIGKVTKIKKGRNGYINFQFYVNGILYEASDPDDASWPKFVRKTRPILNRYYKVEYDSKDPYNSKVLIDINSKSDIELLNKGVQVKANVDNAFFVSDSYVDLIVSYNYEQGDFSFRTRLHKDSLPCGLPEDCKYSSIDLVINKDYPEVNNLYFKSYDRIAMKKAKLKNKKFVQ